MFLKQIFIFLKLVSQSKDLALQTVDFCLKGTSLEGSRWTVVREEVCEDVRARIHRRVVSGGGDEGGSGSNSRGKIEPQPFNLWHAPGCRFTRGQSAKKGEQ